MLVLAATREMSATRRCLLARLGGTLSLCLIVEFLGLFEMLVPGYTLRFVHTMLLLIIHSEVHTPSMASMGTHY